MRPKSEWISHVDESLRIVSGDLFERAQQRMRPKCEAVTRSGGRPKYLLSGLLRCDTCRAHYIGVNGTEYGCSSHRDGGACSNSIRIRRELVESVLLDPIRKELLSPARVQRLVIEMQAYHMEQVRVLEARASEQPHELQEIVARIARLHERLRQGDPDMTADEVQAAIDRAELSAPS
jgi:site-specific DNA recombinase